MPLHRALLVPCRFRGEDRHDAHSCPRHIYSHLLDRWGAPCCNDGLPTGALQDYRSRCGDVRSRGVDHRTARVPPILSLLGDTGETGGGHWCGWSDW
jgi:hypothetical protein